MIEIGLIISAFIAGLFMFLAPCTLPLLTDNFGLTIQYGYKLLKFLNYEEFILDFL